MYYTIFVEIIAEHNAVCQGQYQGPEFFLAQFTMRYETQKA